MHSRLAHHIQEAYPLTRPQRLANPLQLRQGGCRRDPVRFVLVQRTAELEGDQVLFHRQQPRADIRQAAVEQAAQSGVERRQFLRALGLRQVFQGLQLRLRHTRRGVVTARLDPADLQAAILKDAKVAVRHGDALVAARGQERHPAEDTVQRDGQTGPVGNVIQHRLEILHLRCARLLDPQPIDVHVQDPEAVVFGGFLGRQERLAPVGCHCLVGFDAAKAGILVPQVAEAGHQQPLVGLSAHLIALDARIPLRQGTHGHLHLDAFLQQRLERERHQPHVGLVDVHVQLRHQRRFGDVLADRLGRDVEVHHHARVHRDEVHLAHVTVQADGRLVDQPALVAVEQAQCRARIFRLLLVPGDHHPHLEGGDHLHGGDARAGRDARGDLQRQTGDAPQLEHAVQTVITPQHGVGAVEMQPSEQMHLCAAVNDLPVGKVDPLAFVLRSPIGFAVERQRHLPLARDCEIR